VVINDRELARNDHKNRDNDCQSTKNDPEKQDDDRRRRKDNPEHGTMIVRWRKTILSRRR
jgi:hypothetical protein